MEALTRDETILTFLPYVERLSNSLCYMRGINDFSVMEDCCSSGVAVLIESVDNYDPECGASLYTWINQRVNWAIKDFLKVVLFGRGRRWTEKEEDLNAKVSLNRDGNLVSQNLQLTDIENIVEYSMDGIEDAVYNADFVKKISDFVNNISSIGEVKCLDTKMNILWRYFVEGYTQCELAEENNCSQWKISSIISRLKSDIIDRFGKDFLF